MATIMNLSDLINEANGTNNTAEENAKQEARENVADLDNDLQTAVNKIIDLPGINIEICGKWVWVSGDTRAVKNELKTAGFFWARKKQMWYYRKAEDRRWYKGKTATMEHIRDKYGSEELKTA